jgi:arabinosyltransferase
VKAEANKGGSVVQVLGLGIIIPQFTAGQDRYWAPHMGTIPGSATKLPFKAPIDHVLDLERMLGQVKPPAEFGPNVPYREYSFLENPACPEAIKGNQMTVNVCEEQLEKCSDGSKPAKLVDGALWVMGSMNDQQLKTALGDAAKKYPVLKFNSTIGLFTRHVDDQDHKRFMNRMKLMASIWCCVNPGPGKPGHVWYDMWWDTVPHTDLHNREWKEPWHIVLGP